MRRAALGPDDAMLELGHGFRAVDVHTRLDPGDDRPEERGRVVAPERLERELHQAGIVRAVAVPGARDRGYLAANNAVARLCVDRPLVAFARLDGPRRPGSRVSSLVARREPHHATAADVREFAYDERFHGFALHPARDGLPDAPVLDALSEAGLPTLVGAGPGFPPGDVADHLLGRGFPVVVATVGGDPLDRAAMHGAIDLCEDHDDLYLSTAAVRYREALERALAEHPDRVLFGSGAPAVHPNVAVMELLTCSVPENVMRRAFDGNASRVVPALAPRAE